MRLIVWLVVSPLDKQRALQYLEGLETQRTPPLVNEGVSDCPW